MKKRSVTIQGHPTSVSIEDEFWMALQALARDQTRTINDLVGEIDGARTSDTNLSSAIRLYVLRALQRRRTA
ncbi:MAG: ribbon-helix-helix domain-containing protein [Alphaproteobacteria bacterium]|nr:ribbon-helix-helix domain-containing protein [Alphaproteobacteria bacterium]